MLTALSWLTNSSGKTDSGLFILNQAKSFAVCKAQQGIEDKANRAEDVRKQDARGGLPVWDRLALAIAPYPCPDKQVKDEEVRPANQNPVWVLKQ
jgi:hypothetical protein